MDGLLLSPDIHVIRQFPQQQGGHFGFLEQIHKPLTLNEERIINRITASVKGFHISLPFGKNHIRFLYGSLGFGGEIIQHRAGNAVAVSDDREGNPYFPGVFYQGIVIGRAAPNQKCNL